MYVFQHSLIFKYRLTETTRLHKLHLNMATEEMSSSEHWRRQGNTHYTSITPGMAPTVGTERFKQAIQCYKRAFEMGKNEEEQSSAAKNIGMACWRLVNLTSDGSVSYLDMYMIMYHCKEAFKYFSYAFIHGQKVKSQNWIEGVLTNARACWTDVADNILELLDIDPRCQAIYDIAMVIEIDRVKGECFFKLAECQFHRGILALQNDDYKKCLGAMRECYMPLNEAPRLCPEEHILAEVKVLEEDVQMHQCMAESIQARVIGDGLFAKVLLDEETLNMDMVWEVIDWYKQATLRTKEITEVELEAIAVSRIGRVYDKVLKLKYKAREYYKHAIQLAHSMFPRTFALEEWYKEASQALAKYQTETVQEEDDRKNLDKLEILKELENEIKQLKELRDKNHTDFLTFVYKTFPPKKESLKLVLPTSKDNDWHIKMKKTLQQAVVHYHPDSVDEEQHGKKWKVLCEEITKFCTQRYELMKG